MAEALAIMEAILNSFLLVALTEMGDKTQLLAFVLAARYRNPWAVMAGILVATILNHALAAFFGSIVSQYIPPDVLKWILALTFLAFAAWILIPDKDEEIKEEHKYGAFITTLILFFFAEMGDKTQLSTVALAARYNDIVAVTIGTTLGMMFADGLAVAFGKTITEKISMKWVRWIAAASFVVFGVAIIIGF